MSVININKNLLKPSPLTTLIYGEFSCSNEQDHLLFESIKLNGILEPLIVSEENVIISGYRRHYVAMMTTTIQEIPVIVKRVDKITQLLIIQHNLQRKKNVAQYSYDYEVIREALGSKQGKKLSKESKDELDKAQHFVNDKVSESTRKRVKSSVEILMRRNPKLSKLDAYKEISNRINIGESVDGIKKRLESEERKRNNQERAKDYEDFSEENFQIILGDARTAHSQIKKSSVQSLVTSPPYFNMRHYSGRELDKGDFPIGEEPTAEMYVERQAEVFANYVSKIKSGGSVFVNVMDKIINGKVGRIPDQLITAMVKKGFIFVQDAIWFKANPPFSGGGNTFQPSREYILHFICKDEKYYWDSDFLNDNNLSLMNDALYGGEGKKKQFRNTIILSPQRIQEREDPNLESIENYVGGLIATGVFNPEKLIKLLKSKGFEHNHNAMFDFEVPMLCILVSSKQGDLILDVYSGLATTGIVAFGMKRKYIGIEFSKGYADQSKARFDAMFGTGKQRAKTSKGTPPPNKKASSTKSSKVRSTTE
jgi:DNA modification methylase